MPDLQGTAPAWSCDACGGVRFAILVGLAACPLLVFLHHPVSSWVIRLLVHKLQVASRVLPILQQLAGPTGNPTFDECGSNAYLRPVQTLCKQYIDVSGWTACMDDMSAACGALVKLGQPVQGVQAAYFCHLSGHICDH